MNDWASRRKSIYLGLAVLLLTSISFLIFWKFWYKVPSCFDRLQNGDEKGIDCGGSCSLVCSEEVLTPVVRFDPRLFKIYDNLYSVLALVENYNINYHAPSVPYRFQIYDDKGKIIYERFGTTTLPQRETVAIFEGSIVIENAKPKKVSFDLSQNIIWYKNSTNKLDIKITNSPLLRQESAPRVEVKVENESLDEIRNLELVAIIFDGKDNPIAASRTFVDLLKKGEKTEVFFTWPKPFDLGEKICDKPSDVVLAIDRSGSMSSLSKNPPEPLTSVKKAASYFISELKENDKVGLLTFATSVGNEARTLSSSFEELKDNIARISILDEGVQYTNIAEALNKAKEFFTEKESLASKKVIVLLTDGVANKPEPPNFKNEAEAIAYAEEEALRQAAMLKQQGIIIYTIGLGKEISESFLKKIASNPENFFLAPATSTLANIYKEISSSICKELPAKIEIKHKILR